MFSAKIRKIKKKILLKFFNFYNLKKICILHGHVLVMWAGPVLFKHYVVPSVGKMTKSLPFRNSSVESYYAYSEDGSTQGYYYLNNFDNIFISGGKNIFLAL